MNPQNSSLFFVDARSIAFLRCHNDINRPSVYVYMKDISLSGK